MSTARNGRYANGARRRALRTRVLMVYDSCAICGKPVDKAIRTPDPMSPEVDEIVPFSLGGDPLAWDNVQLTHRICNQRKGNGSSRAAAPERIVATLALQFPTTQDW